MWKIWVMITPNMFRLTTIGMSISMTMVKHGTSQTRKIGRWNISHCIFYWNIISLTATFWRCNEVQFNNFGGIELTPCWFSYTKLHEYLNIVSIFVEMQILNTSNVKIMTFISFEQQSDTATQRWIYVLWQHNIYYSVVIIMRRMRKVIEISLLNILRSIFAC